MAQKGKPSEAHVYDAAGCCIYCQMYRVNVDRLNHVCDPEREAEYDAKEENENGQNGTEQERHQSENERILHDVREIEYIAESLEDAIEAQGHINATGVCIVQIGA
jgi:hypothetical protein